MALDLEALDAPTVEGATVGAPMRLPLDAIDEDAEQPRREFDQDALQELAETIRARGVRQPVSVRPHPERPGRWILNFGARRLRASKLAGLTDIPAFVDASTDRYDQVIENEQREGLKPLELALFVQRRIAAGESQAEIARRLGKSRQWVTLATALIDAPDWLMTAYRHGRCRGMKELYELRRLAGEHPQDVAAWVVGQESITRDRVETLRANLFQRDAAGASTDAPDRTAARPTAAPEAAAPCESSASRRDAHRRRSQPMLHARLDGHLVCIDADRVPQQPGHVFVRHSGETSAHAVDASRLALLGFGPG